MDGSKNPMLPPAVYANYLRVAHQQSEFFLTFGQAQGQAGSAHLAASLVTSPAQAKAMLEALSESVKRYEKRFGPIPANEAPAPATAKPARVAAKAAPKRAGRGRRAKSAKSA